MIIDIIGKFPIEALVLIVLLAAIGVAALAIQWSPRLRSIWGAGDGAARLGQTADEPDRRREGLLNSRWQKDKSANNVAALITLIVLAHHADENGTGQPIHDQICAATGLSRSKVSGGLATLTAERLITAR
jgi:hypothetical protein